MTVTLPADVLDRYRRFSLYNSPYPAHDRGRAIDLYPGMTTAPSPVAGDVLDTRTVRAPPKPYAPECDHLLLVDTGGVVARILHVDPGVEPGDTVEVGDPIGETVRSGFFAPWVGNHVHLGFRDPDANPYRASGSLPIGVDVLVEPLAWDGTGRVAEVGDTFVVLDSPAHPAPDERFAGIGTAGGGVLDGGLPHYDGGGVLFGGDGPVSLIDTPVGRADGRHVEWSAIEVVANGEPITGLSLSVAREPAVGARLVYPDHGFDIGDRIDVTIRPNR